MVLLETKYKVKLYLLKKQEFLLLCLIYLHTYLIIELRRCFSPKIGLKIFLSLFKSFTNSRQAGSCTTKVAFNENSRRRNE